MRPAPFVRPRKPISHVGIYIGEGLFIHAASRSKKVKLSDIDQRYYLTRLVGARRYLPQRNVTFLKVGMNKESRD